MHIYIYIYIYGSIRVSFSLHVFVSDSRCMYMGPYLGVCIVSLSRCLYLCLIVVVVWGAGSTGQDPLTSSSSLKRKLWYPERERDRETERQREAH